MKVKLIRAKVGSDPEHLPASGGEKVVRRLDTCPELVQALREGDVLTGRLLCERLFNFADGKGLNARQAQIFQASAPQWVKLFRRAD